MKTLPSIAWAGAFLLAVVGVARADRDDWQKVEGGESLSVEARSVGDSAVRQVRVTLRSPLPPRALFDALWDVESQRQWAPNLKLLRVVSRTADSVVVYEQVHVPVIKDRDYTLKLTRVVDEARQVYEVTAVSAPELGPPPDPHFVRMTRIASTFTIEPAGQGSQLVYVAFGDPAGSVPRWLIRIADIRGAKDFVLAIAKRAAQSR